MTIIESEKRVNHPSYYEKNAKDGRVHPECIVLLEIITDGLPGILAIDLGQLKYVYRFGHKSEEGLSVTEKAIEDLNKVLWYAKNLESKFCEYKDKIEVKKWTSKSETLARLVAEEFAFDKLPVLHEDIYNVIKNAMMLSTTEANPAMYVKSIEKLINSIELIQNEAFND